MVAFAQRYQPLLSRYHAIATGITGQRISASTNLDVEQMEPGSIGGDAQIAARVVSGEVVAVIFLVDPLNAQTYEPNVELLLRVCNLHSVPIATNLATAEAIVRSFADSLVAHLIFNPASGHGRAEQDLDLIQELLEPNLHLEVHLTSPEISPQQIAERAIGKSADLIIAAGGDGTVSAVAGAIIGTDIPLGIIPRGTANAFGMALGITQQIAQIHRACEIILAGKTRVIDAARCNERPLILLAGVGYEAETIAKADREAKNRWGPLAYIMAGWQQLDEQKLFEAEVEIDGEFKTFEAGAITVANAAPPTSILAQGIGEVVINDGLLDITIATAETRLQALTTMLNMLGSALIKTNREHENIVHLRSRKVKIAAAPPQKVVLDGEIIGNTPIEVECIPQALKVFVPVNGDE